ncbi:MAG TPA: T9SS type A sorting domain-containing protein, partial [Bacteroidia bacterium]|nr:T9SS type A sorting domain-containing protein [Bacteroidia bacterium]
MKNKLLTLALLLGFCIITYKGNSQTSRRSFGTAANETNSFVLNYNGNEHLIIANSTAHGNGDILVSKYNSVTRNIISRNYYGSDDIDERTISCLINDANELVLLVNDYTNDWIKIFIIDPVSGTVTNSQEYKIDEVIRIRGVEIEQGTDGNYYVVANRIMAFSEHYTQGYFLVFDNGLNLVHNMEFNLDQDPMGLYDLDQLNDDEWVVIGAKAETHSAPYESLVFIYNPSTGNKVLEDLHDFDGDRHDSYDRVIVDNANERIYIGHSAHRDPNNQLNMGITCFDYGLNEIWNTEFNTTGNGENERLSTLIFDPVDNLLYLSGYNEVNFEYAFISCVDAANGNRLWTKHPDGMVRQNISRPFRIALQNQHILYTGYVSNGSDDDIFWGAETNDAEASGCFATKEYDQEEVPRAGDINIILVEPAFTEGNIDIDVTPVTINDIVACVGECEPPQGFVVLADETITENTFWGTQTSGIKYFIDGTLTVSAGVTLDATNVDVMFAEDAQIVLQSGASLRANNSVFRPCNPQGTWRGIFFLGDPTGVVNNCVFKNANFALDLGGLNNHLKITNNQFSNCLVGVHLKTQTSAGGSVTGNKFFVDNDELTFPLVNPGYSTNNYYTGVLLSHAMFGELLVSQNEFIYANSSEQVNRMYGINAISSRAKISENTFTNCYRAIDVPFTYPLSIENNEIEVTREHTNNDYQIRISGNHTTDPSKVANNRISNFNLITDPATVQAAIYVDFFSGIEINDNTINGYKIGIQLNSVLNANIYSNHIKSTLYGIHAVSLGFVSIRCNDIDMGYNTVGAGISTGIYYYKSNTSPVNIEIRGNCILNSYDAIVLFSASDMAIPLIKNNYLYNYYHVGIYSMNFLGSIGTGPTAPNAGRNVFISNNKNGVTAAFDIYSTDPLSENGNYNMTVRNAMVIGGLLNSSYSTTSCGHFFANNVNARIELEDKCHIPFSYTSTLQNYQWPEIVGGGGGGSSTPSGYGTDTERLTYWSQVAKELHSNTAEFKKLETKMDHEEQNPEVLGLFKAYASILNKEYTQAETLLNQTQVTDAKLATTKNRLLLLSRIAGRGTNLDAAAKKEIASLVNENDFFALELRAGLNPWDQGFEYVFAPVRTYEQPAPESKRFFIKEIQLSIYPNPVSGNEVVVDITTPEHAETILFVRDILGRVVQTQPIGFSAGTAAISTEALPNGVYFVSL